MEKIAKPGGAALGTRREKSFAVPAKFIDHAGIANPGQEKKAGVFEPREVIGMKNFGHRRSLSRWHVPDANCRIEDPGRQIPLVNANGIVLLSRIRPGGKPMADDEQQPDLAPREPLFPPIPHIEAYKPGIDRTLLVENLKLTPMERLARLADLGEGIMELRKSIRRHGAPTK